MGTIIPDRGLGAALAAIGALCLAGCVGQGSPSGNMVPDCAAVDMQSIESAARLGDRYVAIPYQIRPLDGGLSVELLIGVPLGSEHAEAAAVGLASALTRDLDGARAWEIRSTRSDTVIPLRPRVPARSQVPLLVASQPGQPPNCELAAHAGRQWFLQSCPLVTSEPLPRGQYAVRLTIPPRFGDVHWSAPSDPVLLEVTD